MKRAYLVDEWIYTIGRDGFRQLHQEQNEDLQAGQGRRDPDRLPLR